MDRKEFLKEKQKILKSMRSSICITRETAIELVKAIEELEQYQKIGELEEVRELVSKGKAYNQVAWERDVALEQLGELGLSLGQKTEDAKFVIKNLAE